MQFFFPRQSSVLSMRLAGWKSGWTNGYKGKYKSNISRAPVNKSKRRLITTKVKNMDRGARYTQDV